MPKARRALTELLRAVGEGKILVSSPDRPVGMPLGEMTRNEFLAFAVWQLVLYGRVQTPDGLTLEFKTAKEHLDAIKWLYAHIDGGPPKEQITELGEGWATVFRKAFEAQQRPAEISPGSAEKPPWN